MTAPRTATTAQKFDHQPERLEREQFTLRMLSVADVVGDFAAINDRVLPDGKPDPWSETTFLENLADLGWHEVEFRMRRSFAYTVVRPDESEVVGCFSGLPGTGWARPMGASWRRPNSR